MKKARATETELKVDTTIYPMEAVQQACYSFIDRAHVRIASSGKGQAKVCVKAKGAVGLEGMEDAFYEELLHQSLRLKVSESNRSIREFIVTKALVSAQPGDGSQQGAQGQGGEQDCPECRAEAEGKKGGAAQAEGKGGGKGPEGGAVDKELEAEIEKLLAEIEKTDTGGGDPLGVAVPWEDKYGGKGKAGAKKGGAVKKVAVKKKVKGAK